MVSKRVDTKLNGIIKCKSVFGLRGIGIYGTQEDLVNISIP